MIEVWRRLFNMVAHLHLQGCTCKINKKVYTLENSFTNFAEARNSWEVSGQGAVFHLCLKNHLDTNGIRWS